MSLPTLPISKFELNIPSTKKLIEFRPYRVAEEKILLLAAESGDEKQMLRAIKQVVSICTDGKVIPDDLAVFDLEYIFLKIRAKSVGETAEVGLKCDACQKFTDVSINLDQVEMNTPGSDTAGRNGMTIMLTPDIGITAKPVSVRDLSRIDASTTDKGSLVTNLVAASIATIFDSKGVHRAEDVPPAELAAFVDTLSRAQIESIDKYIRSLPRLEKNVEFTCTSCKHVNNVTLSGLQSFFG